MKIYLVRKSTHNENEFSTHNKIIGIYATVNMAQDIFSKERKKEIEKTNTHKNIRKIVDGANAFSMRFDFGYCVDIWIEAHELIEKYTDLQAQ